MTTHYISIALHENVKFKRQQLNSFFTLIHDLNGLQAPNIYQTSFSQHADFNDMLTVNSVAICAHADQLHEVLKVLTLFAKQNQTNISPVNEFSKNCHVVAFDRIDFKLGRSRSQIRKRAQNKVLYVKEKYGDELDLVSVEKEITANLEEKQKNTPHLSINLLSNSTKRFFNLNIIKKEQGHKSTGRYGLGAPVALLP